MTINIEVSDIELFAKALNNAIVSYGDILSSAKFELDLPLKYEHLFQLSDKELEDRFAILKDVYFQVERIERLYKEAKLLHTPNPGEK